MRLFKFLAIFLIVVGLIFIIVVGSNWRVFTTVFGNQEALAEGSEWVEKTYSLSGLTEFAGENPQYVSVVVLSDDSTSTLISQGAAVPRAMGSTGHLFILMAWAQAVDSGDIMITETVSLSALESFVVPGHERSRHREVMKLLHDSGAIQNDHVPVRILVNMMIRRNHQPSADVVYHIVGADRVREITMRFLGDQAQPPLPWSGFYMAAIQDIPAHDEPLDSTLVTGFHASAMNMFQSLSSSEISLKDALPPSRQKDVSFTFFEEKSIYRLLPQAQPAHMAQAIRKALLSDELGESVRSLVLDVLRWPMEDSRITRDFSFFTAIYDNRISISSGISIGTSVYTGETLISAVYFDQLPVGFWMHLSANLMLQDFQMRLKYDPAMFELAQLQLKE
jgi:hypothetical protein